MSTLRDAGAFVSVVICTIITGILALLGIFMVVALLDAIFVRQEAAGEAKRAETNPKPDRAAEPVSPRSTTPAMLEADNAPRFNPKEAVWIDRGVIQDTAVETYEALSIHPNDPFAHTQMADSLLKRGRVDDAIAACDTAIALSPDIWSAWFVKGKALLRSDKPDEALKAVERSIALNPLDASGWELKGLILYNLGNFEACMDVCDRLLRINPDSKEYWINKAAVLYNLGEKKNALIATEHSLSIDPAYAIAVKNREAIQRDLAAEEAQNEKQLQNMVTLWEEKGYNVGRLRTERSLLDSEHTFHSYGERISKLQQMQDELDAIKANYAPWLLQSRLILILYQIEADIHDPEKFPELESKFSFLKQQLNRIDDGSKRDTVADGSSRTFNDLPGQILNDMVSQYGTALLDNPDRVRALLVDLCAASPQVQSGREVQVEINILVTALIEQVPQEIRKLPPGEPFDLHRNSLVRRLTILGIDEAASRWAVETWARSLNA